MEKKISSLIFYPETQYILYKDSNKRARKYIVCLNISRQVQNIFEIFSKILKVSFTIRVIKIKKDAR